jgi:hypothetical protein
VGTAVVSDLPGGAVPIARINIVEYLDAETGAHLIDETYWTADDSEMPLYKKLGLLEQAKVAACIPMIQSAPDMLGGDDA